MMILGSAAAPAIPELTRLAATRGDSWAFEALGDIGPPALPVLLTFLNNQRAPAASRAYAAQQFRKLGTNALVALPSLIQCLSDTNVWFACCCATAIADLTLEPKTSIPALAKCLRSTHQTLRVISVQSIARFGPAAKLVLSELKEAETSETDLPTKDYLQRVIEKIDPSAPPFRMQLRAF
jgi:HEAT repeat protein